MHKSWISALAGMTLLAGTAFALWATTARADEPPPRETAAEEAAQPGAAPAAQPGGDNFDFFSDKPVEGRDVVELPPEKSRWLTVGGPIALVALFFLLDL